ncbi:hypothetical protein GF325_19095, partial [Candidatus Bathyarchaeota archaeon]|nr:hypothetical protein [Candidatus Bathyarchaeota archaeon]
MEREEIILRVDLSTGTITRESAREEDMQNYIGGAGVGAALFAREVSPRTDAFDDENKLIISVGPFTGTSVPFNGRHFMVSKSPLTGIMGEASAGGYFAKELACAGFNHVVISGKSEKPVYLWIHDGDVELRDASGVWGQGTSATEDAIMAELGDPKIKVASIGPAGENLVRYAAIINEKDRAAGRCGLGAVMGSKHLKAIAVRGTGKVTVIDKEALQEAVKELQQLVKDSLLAGVFSNYGTVSNYSNAAIGDVPVKNYTRSRWKGNNNLDAEVWKEKRTGTHGCYACPVRCTGLVNHEGKQVRWPEYETVASMGSNLMVDNPDALIDWNVKVNDIGMDTISLGSCIAGLLECMDRKLLPKLGEDLGFDIPDTPWGDEKTIETIIDLIAARKGIGDSLAEGIKRFVEHHNLPPELATHGKGLEVPMHEPRANNLTALDYFTTNRGAYHCYLPMAVSSNMNFKKEIGVNAMVGRFSSYSGDNMEGKRATVEAVVKLQDASEAYSACGACIFGFQFIDVLQPWIDALNAICGMEHGVKSWVGVGERLFNLKRLYNMKCGITKQDDTLGKRFFERIMKGGTKKHIPPRRKLLDRYYDSRGWTEDGKPTGKSWLDRPKVRPRRVIDYVADMLEESGITQVFSLPGGATPFFVEECFKRPETFNTIVPRHEGAAAVMGDIYARLNRKPALVVGQGVWMATNGGFGIAEAFFAGTPMVIITEFSDWYGLNHFGSYQMGNGEYGAVDLRNMYKAMTKRTFVATEPAELYFCIQQAIKHSMTGRPGPTCVIAKWNTMLGLIRDPMKVEPYPLQPLKGYLNVEPPSISTGDAKKVARMLLDAEDPVMICGRGVHAANAYDEVRELAELIGMPVATSYMGKSSIEETHDLALGSTGSIGQKLANYMVSNADVILAVGTCLAPDNTSNCSFDFIHPRYQDIIQIDIESRNAGWTYPVKVGITSDAKVALREILAAIIQEGVQVDVEERVARIKKMKEDDEMEFFWSKYFFRERIPIDPERIVKSVNERIRKEDLLLLDGGNNRMWFTKLFQTTAPGQLIGPGGAAGIGWCTSAVIGAAIAKEGQEGKVIGIIGDGGFMMGLYNLETARQLDLPFIYIILNNSSLGNVRDYLTARGRKVMEYEETNFAAIANAMGVK